MSDALSKRADNLAGIVRGERGRAERLEGELRSARAVLAERERELLELKGPCSTRGCRLHYAHAGPCDIKPESRIGDQVKFDQFVHRIHGWTSHGHACCELLATDPPPIQARCGGPGLCTVCSVQAARYHAADDR